jgi:hypothetical protein
MIYEIERVRAFNGEPKEREARRKGHRVEILSLELDEPLLIRYIDDGYAVLQTSGVMAYNANYKTENHLTVQTKNTVYVFRKVSE